MKAGWVGLVGWSTPHGHFTHNVVTGHWSTLDRAQGRESPRIRPAGTLYNHWATLPMKTTSTPLFNVCYRVVLKSAYWFVGWPIWKAWIWRVQEIVEWYSHVEGTFSAYRINIMNCVIIYYVWRKFYVDAMLPHLLLELSLSLQGK